MGLIRSHKLLLAIGLAATVWYHLNKRKKASTGPDRVDEETTQYVGGGS